MRCEDCNRFDETARRCKDGKVNPRFHGEAVEVANQFGVRVICIFNEHRERLVSTRTLNALSRSAPPKARRNRPDLQ